MGRQEAFIARGPSWTAAVRSIAKEFTAAAEPLR
jgi:hypothetical protein